MKETKWRFWYDDTFYSEHYGSYHKARCEAFLDRLNKGMAFRPIKIEAMYSMDWIESINEKIEI
jgi:hypothetical protein